MVAEGQLERVTADGPAEDLVAEANAEDRHLSDEFADRVHRVVHHGRIAGPVRQEHPGGLHREDIGRRRGCGHHGHPAERGEVIDDRELDAEVVGDDVAVTTADGVRGRRGHLSDEVHTIRAGLGDGRGTQRGHIGAAEGPAHRACVAEQPGQAPRVDGGDAADAVARQHRGEMGLGAMIRLPASQIAHDHAPAERPAGLEIGERGAVVADVGVGERDDLARVAGVCEDLLIAAQHGVEHHLATAGHAAFRGGADQLALEHAAVGQHQRTLTNRLLGHVVHPCIFIHSNACSFIFAPRRRSRPDPLGTPCGAPCPARSGLRRACSDSCWRALRWTPSR